LGVELLVTDQPQRATELARYIDTLNAQRQTLELSIRRAAARQAREQFDPENDAALVLAERGWHPGVIGIVAGRLAEQFARPVVLIAMDETGVKTPVGSARSVPGFDLHAALGECAGHLLGHGGHAAAAGLKIEPGKIDAFRAAFCAVAASALPEGNGQGRLDIDAEVTLGSCTLAAVDQLDRLAPFGQGNRRPLFCATGVRLDGEPKTIGRGDRHLSLRLSQDGVRFRAVAFGAADWATPLAKARRPIDVAFHPMINTFRGQRSVELQLVDWREEGSADESH
jgi:single-stranded-DNA-specific exonuclease